MPTVNEADEHAQKLWKDHFQQCIFGATHPLWNWQEQLTEDESLALEFSHLYESCFGDSLDTSTSRYVHLIRKMDSLLSQTRLAYRDIDNPVLIDEH